MAGVDTAYRFSEDDLPGLFGAGQPGDWGSRCLTYLARSALRISSASQATGVQLARKRFEILSAQQPENGCSLAHRRPPAFPPGRSSGAPPVALRPPEIVLNPGQRRASPMVLPRPRR